MILGGHEHYDDKTPNEHRSDWKKRDAKTGILLTRWDQEEEEEKRKGEERQDRLKHEKKETGEGV